MKENQIFTLSKYEKKLQEAYNNGKAILVDKPMSFSDYNGYLDGGLIVESEDIEFYQSKSKQSLGKTINEVEIITNGNPIEVIVHPRFSYPVMHNHSYIEMIYVYNGKCKHFIEDKGVDLREGDICILSPNTFHSLSVTDEETIVINVLMSKKLFQSEVMEVLQSNKKNPLSSFIDHVLFGHRVSPYLVINTINSQKIKTLIYQMLVEREEKHFKYNINLKLLLQQVFIEIIRNYSNVIQITPAVEQDYDDFIEAILAYVTLNYNKTNLKDVSYFFGYDSKYLGQKLKRYTGRTFNEILSRLQVEHARQLIEATELSITDICQEVGCFDASHLTKKFKKIYGESPLYYRQ